ncbi:metal-dependent hydrolase, partial [Staphylococcus capitis]
VLLWIVGVHPYLAFFPIVAILVVYYIVRFMMQATIKKEALKRIDRSHNAVKVFVAPTIKFHVWRVAIQTEQHDYVGTARWKDVEFTDKVKRQSMTP